MRLKDWRALAGLTFAQVAEGIGASSPGTVEKHEKGFTTPEPDVQARYEDFTKGAVTPTDWIEQHRERKASPPQRSRAYNRREPAEAAE